MTKIYIYCIFDNEDGLHAVYSSLKSAHKDAMKLANRSGTGVYVFHDGKSMQPDLTFVRNIFKGEIDLKVYYYSNKHKITILKTKLKD
jgi:hypothetical protein|tara:strand:- start:2047 stop:2310 length:264 start_codon:yes stop_codon:yes gene_type:complete